MAYHDLIGLGSYAFRYAARKRESPMDCIAFVEAVARLGLTRALICENLHYSDMGGEYIRKLAKTAARHGITVEVGMRVASRDNLAGHIKIAQALGAKLVRLVLGDTTHDTLLRDRERRHLMAQALPAIKAVTPLLEDGDISLGIENHFDLHAVELLELVQQINSPRVGLIFDSTNCLCFAEKPHDVLRLMKGHLLSVHIKDYDCTKVDGGYMFSGVDLGEGVLDIPGLIKTAHGYNPRASFIVEYNMQPATSLPENELLAWEEERAAKNVKLTVAAVTQALDPGN